MIVKLTNSTTGDVRNVKVGFSWTGLFFGFIPLFFRGLHKPAAEGFGIIIVSLFLLSLFAGRHDDVPQSILTLLFFSTFFTITINCLIGGIVGFMLNGLTVRGLLKRGYTMEQRGLTLEEYAKGMA